MNETPKNKPISLGRWILITILAWLGMLICTPISFCAWILHRVTGFILTIAVLPNDGVHHLIFLLLSKKEQDEGEDEEQAD